METKNRQKLLIILAAIAIGAFIGDAVIFEPLLKSWKARSEHIGQLKKSLSDGRKSLARGDVIRDNWDRMRTNTLDLNLSTAEADFLKAFDKWAKSSGISVAGIHPQWKQAEDYSTLECRAEATGNIETLARFLYNVERAHSIHNDETEHVSVRIDSVEVTARDNSGEQLALVIQVSGLQLFSPQQ